MSIKEKPWRVCRGADLLPGDYSTSQVKALGDYPRLHVWREGRPDWADPTSLPEFADGPPAAVPGETARTSPDAPATAAAAPAVLDLKESSVFDYWRLMYWHPSAFFNARPSVDNPPYFPLVFVMIGLGGAIDRLEMKSLQHDLGPGSATEAAFWMESWPLFWGFVIGSGLFSAAIRYLLGGWWFKIRLRWAGGDPDRATARYLNFYTEFPVSSLIVLFALHDLWVYASPADAFNAPFDLVVLLRTVLASILLYWSTFVSYKGARILGKTALWKGRIWFLILPIILYTLAFLVLVAVGFAAGLQSAGGVPD